MALNPFHDNPFKNLSKGQKIAIAGGTLAIGGYMVIRHHSKTGSWNPWSKTPSSAAGNGTQIDPVTGLAYSQDNQIDPITNLPYLAEAEQYGSIAAAESSVTAYGASVPSGSGIGVSPASPGGGITTMPGSGYASNQDWIQAVQAGLTDIGYDLTIVNAALQGYFANQPLPDNEYQVMRVALAEFGNPPNGSFSLIKAPPAPPTGTPPTGPTGPAIPVTLGQLAAPGNFSVTPFAKGLDAGWGSVSGAEIYELRVEGPTSKDLHQTGTHARVTGLKAGKYTVNVRAGRSGTDIHGRWSVTKTVTVR